MTCTAKKVTVGVTATLLTQGQGGLGPQGISDFSAEILNNDATVALYVGDANVTVATGFPLAAGQAIQAGSLGADDAVYGIVASATLDCRVWEFA
jgi:hypothetical protein